MTDGQPVQPTTNTNTSFKEKVEAMQAKVPPPNDGPTTYPLASLTDADKVYLMRMDLAYRQALKSVPGAHEVWFDVLTDASGRTWSEQKNDGTKAGAALHLAVSEAVNSTDRLPGAYAHTDDKTPYTYNGPLVQVLGAAVAKKLKR